MQGSLPQSKADYYPFLQVVSFKLTEVFAALSEYLATKNCKPPIVFKLNNI